MVFLFFYFFHPGQTGSERMPNLVKQNRWFEFTVVAKLVLDTLQFGLFDLRLCGFCFLICLSSTLIEKCVLLMRILISVQSRL